MAQPMVTAGSHSLLQPTRTHVAVKGASCVLIHVPGLVLHGSKPRRECLKDEALTLRIREQFRSYRAAVAYGPNQAFIGNMDPRTLFERPQPWWLDPVEGASRSGPFGEIMPEEEFWGLLKIADTFDLVHLREDVADEAIMRLSSHPLLTQLDVAKIGTGKSESRVMSEANSPQGLPLWDSQGRVVGAVLAGHDEDSSQSAEIMLENLAAKASGMLALRHLLRQTNTPAERIGYVLGCGEEAVGDRYQRGGGNLAKAMAEMATLSNADGADVKAFCCAPVHATVIGGALIAAGVQENVIIDGGGSLAKLGMKFLGALGHHMPILEDCLAAVAIQLGHDNGEGNPRLRLDVIGQHNVGLGSSQKALYEALVLEPLRRVGLTIPEVDRYAVELHNAEIMESGRSGNVSRTNYRMIASLAAMSGQLRDDEIDGFERRFGMPGYVPTQGHVPAAVPYLPHALAEMRNGGISRAMFVAKGSLFLGKMTNLADGMSFLVEASPPPRSEADESSRGTRFGAET